jgi:hypothetical protein
MGQRAKILPIQSGHPGGGVPEIWIFSLHRFRALFGDVFSDNLWKKTNEQVE